MFGSNERVAHGFGVRRGLKLVQHAGFHGQQAQAGQRMQMQPVILATDQEEQTGGFAIRGAEVDFLDWPPHNEEGSFEEVRFHLAGMGHRETARHCGRTQVLARLQAFQQGLRVVKLAGFIGHRHQVA